MRRIILVFAFFPFLGMAQTQLAQNNATSKTAHTAAHRIVVQENSDELICDFYPNTATGLIHTACSSSVLAYKLVDMNGKTVVNLTPSENRKIRIEEVPQGIYILHIEDIDHRLTSKKITISY